MSGWQRRATEGQIQVNYE